MMPVITNLWKDKVVYAFVTASKNGKGSRRLFLCTADPRTISFEWENSADKTTCSYGAENIFYLPLAWYGLRWNIKVSYYEGRTFWSMEVMKAFLDISPPVPRKPDTKLVSKFSQI